MRCVWRRTESLFDRRARDAGATVGTVYAASPLDFA